MLLGAFGSLPSPPRGPWLLADIDGAAALEAAASMATRPRRRCAQAQWDAFVANKKVFEGEKGANGFRARLAAAIASLPPMHAPLSLDVGANCGQNIAFMQSFARRDPCDARVLAFEPSPNTADWLRRAIRTGRGLCGRKRCPDEPARVCERSVAIKQAAVSITRGSASFYSNLADGRLGTGNQLSSLTRRNPNSREYTVETVPLAAEVPPHANITLLKIDVEGNEPLVFASAAPVLPRTRLVQFECGGFAAQPALGYPQKQPLRSIVEFLARRGFHTFRLSAARLLRMDGPFWLPQYEKGSWAVFNCFAIRPEDPLYEAAVRPTLLNCVGRNRTAGFLSQKVVPDPV